MAELRDLLIELAKDESVSTVRDETGHSDLSRAVTEYLQSGGPNSTFETKDNVVAARAAQKAELDRLAALDEAARKG